MQPGATKVLAVIQSAPITTTMNWTLMTSDNLYTECYLRTLGAREKRRSGSPLNAQELGLARVNQILSSLGVDTNLFRQVDGSGLSRYNLVSPAAMIETLKAMDATKYGQVYKSFLPVAGVSGSLKHRFINTPAVGIVHAKTGTLSGVVTVRRSLQTYFKNRN
jgi:serine-type D-Ala-D-Ala carboxypeptidase/endopeptidase (penicillin-binding protein 4)